VPIIEAQAVGIATTLFAARIFLFVAKNSHKLGVGHNPRRAIGRRSSLVQRNSDVFRRVRAAPKLPNKRILRPIAKGFEHRIYGLRHRENAAVIIRFR
jgi:hypothetical protein